MDKGYWAYMGLSIEADAKSMDDGCLTEVPEARKEALNTAVLELAEEAYGANWTGPTSPIIKGRPGGCYHCKGGTKDCICPEARDPKATPLLIAFSGAAGSGKSTALKAAASLLKGPLTHVSFAAPLKAMLRAFYTEVGLPHEDIRRKIEGDLKEEPCPYLEGRWPRAAMQTLGTEWGRETIGPSLWTKAFATKAGTALVEGYTVLTDDCRFENEAEAIKTLGGFVVRIEAAENRRTPGVHASEKGLSAADAVIFNYGSERVLTAQVKNLLVALGARVG